VQNLVSDIEGGTKTEGVKIRVPRIIFELKKNKVTVGWRKLHNEEFHNLYSSPIIIRMTNLRRMRWQVMQNECGRIGIHIGYWWESQKERDH
jgi:hypothetical protein